MIAPTQMKKPSNWQDFEKLCKLLWGEIWYCEDTIKQHGRQGQNQHGVDVYAYVEKYGGYCGIQCKGKDDYTNAELTEAEIEDEIEKALTFEPELKLLVFATTANKDAKIEAYIRKKDVEIFRGSVWSADYSDNRVGNEYDWYGKLDKNYSISFFDRTYGSDNVKTVRQAVKRTPRIIWVNTTTWLAWAIVCAVCNLFFYKLVIPYFERMYMTDAAFAFFDFLIFFLPPVLALLFAFFSFIFVKAKDKVLYECAVRVVADNRAKEHKLRTERNIDRKLSNKWYYNNCPNNI